MTLSISSRDLLERLKIAGGSLPLRGNGREGKALHRRKLAILKKDRIQITLAGRKFLEKNPLVDVSQDEF